MVLIVDGQVVEEQNSGSFFSRTRRRVFGSPVIYANGVSLGSAIAVTISWSENHSILWAIVHGFLSWAYVIYYAIIR